MPSPRNPTVWPRPLSARTIRALSSGVSFANTVCSPPRSRRRAASSRPAQLAAEHDVADVEPDVAADLARHQVVVARQDLHRDSVSGERLERRRRGFLRRIQEADEAGQHQIATRRPPCTRRVSSEASAICHGDDAETVFVQLGHQLARDRRDARLRARARGPRRAARCRRARTCRRRGAPRRRPCR